MKNYLLSIGIGHYANQGAELLSLGRVPANDCDRLAEVLCSELYGFELIQEPLLNENASHDAIISALEGLTELEEDSQLIIHFSGHGEFLADYNMSYWLTHEAVEPSKFNPAGDLGEQGWISAETVVKKVNAASSRHVLILADCCYAGHMRYNFRGMGDYLFPDYTKLAIRTKSREILSPCSVTLTSSPAGDDSVSSFTECIADKLKNKSKFAVISPPMLYGELLARHQHPQYGHLQGVSEPGGYFLFASPERLVEMYKEPFEHDDRVHQVFCSKIEQKLKPISSAIDRARYLDGFIGRQWVFDEINAWIEDPSSRLFWLTGEPGIGKSAVSAYLAEHHEATSAHHFFLFDKAATLDLRQVTRSLAYQLAQVLPDYANYIDQLDDQRLHELDGQSLFDDLIITPLAQVVTNPNIPIIMLLDGLDEASSDGKNEIAEYLAKLIDTAPTWLKIMFSSRTREPEINRSLGKHSPWTLDSADPRNVEDLTLYIKAHLPKCAEKPTLLKAILEKSEGSFLYIKHLCDDWKPRDDLPAINDLPTGLSGIYEQFFRRQFPRTKDYEELALPILELITGAFEPLFVQELAEFSGTSERHIQKVKRRMGSLLRESNGKLEFCHKSLCDWLMNEPASEFYISEIGAHKKLSQKGLRQLGEPPYKLCQYFLKYLIRHLAIEKTNEEITRVLSDCRFLEAKAEKVGIYRLLEDLSVLKGVCLEIDQLRSIIDYHANFINDRPECLFQVVVFQLDGRYPELKNSQLISTWRTYAKEHNKGYISLVYSSDDNNGNIIRKYQIPSGYGFCCSRSELLSADKSNIVIAHDEKIIILDTFSGEIQQKVSCRGLEAGLCAYQDKILYYAEERSFSFVRLNTLTNERRQYFLEENSSLGEAGRRVVPSQNAKYVYWVEYGEGTDAHAYRVDLDTGSWKKIHSQKGHISCVADNSKFIGIGFESQIKLIDKQSHNMGAIKTLRLKSDVCAIAFDNNFMLTGSFDGLIQKWDLRSFQTVYEFKCCAAVHSLQLSKQTMCAGDRYGYVYYWESEVLKYKEKLHSYPVAKAQYIPEYQWIISEPVTGQRIIVSKIQDQAEKQAGEMPTDASAHFFAFQKMLFSKCGQYLVLGGGRRLVLFDLDKNEVACQKTVDRPVVSIIYGNSDSEIYVGIRDSTCLVIRVQGLEIIEGIELHKEKKLLDMTRDPCRDAIYVLFEDHIGIFNLSKKALTVCRQEMAGLSIWFSKTHIYLSDNTGVTICDANDLSVLKKVEHRRVLENGVFKAGESELLMADSEASLATVNECAEEVVDTFPACITDLEYVASNWGNNGLLVLGTNVTGTLLLDIFNKREISAIPERYDKLLKHPTRPLWAAICEDSFRLLTFKNGMSRKCAPRNISGSLRFSPRVYRF